MPWRRIVHSGNELTNVAQTLLTFGDFLVQGGAVLKSMSIVNRDAAAAHRVSVHLVPFGGAPTESNCIFNEIIPPDATVTPVEGPWHEDSKAFVSAISDVADPNVGIRLTAAEEYQDQR